MKKTILILTALFIFMSLRLDAKPDVGISFNFFYSSLRPYGEWIQLDNDLVVWRPGGIDHRWRPYSSGRWSWTADGWYWDSYEPYGWATYHYGRWYNDDYYGWIWIPGYEWAPSWVEWRYDDDYIGWAPLPPYASFHIDLGIHFSIGWHSRYNHWNFVSYRRFYDRRVYNYYLDDRQCERIFEHTKYRTNYYSDRERIINRGVDRSFIERRGGYRIAERKLTSVDNYRDYERNRTGRSDRIYAYRPSDREVENGRDISQFDIKRGENRSTLQREKITTAPHDGGRTIGGDRSAERNRDINVERDTRRDEGRIREESKRVESSNRMPPRMERDRSERKNIDNGSVRADQPKLDKSAKNETPRRTERKIEPKRESNYERPAVRSESKSGRGSSERSNRSETKKDDGRSSSRRK